MAADDLHPVLIIAPLGQDAAGMAALLNAEGIHTDVCGSVDDCAARIAPATGALLLTEEALERTHLARLLEVLRRQPNWSELPLIVLARAGESRRKVLMELTSLVAGSVTVLERPMQMSTLLNAVQVALRSRMRQFQLRDLLAEQQHHLDERIEHAGQLERAIAHSTRENIDRKLAEAALREADRRKDEFLATLAHELRNPLAPVKNSLELMKRADGDLALIEKARITMERQIAQMVRLIDDLLDVSRITRNYLELKTGRIELASVVHHAVEACRPLYEGAGHEFTILLPTDPIYLNADPMRLSQVLGNLLTNSCKYTPPGGRIWLTAEKKRNEVLITLKDTGIGIPSEMLPKVFDLFTQVDRSLERSEGGLGIGLSLVKRLVEMHGGTVTAFSRGLGQGSEFVVRLPILTEIPKPLPQQRPGSEPAAALAQRILIVDDNKPSAASLARLLEIEGSTLQTAHDGVEAIEKAKDFRPELILLDIGLPKMNGYDVCRTIRKQAWGKDVMVVALTGWGQDDDHKKSKDAGFDGHVVKPVDYDALLKYLALLKPGKA